VSRLRMLLYQYSDDWQPVDGQEKFVTYQEWSDLMQANFERCYYIPTGKSSHDIDETSFLTLFRSCTGFAA
jgi:hypothetical protein